MSYLTIDTPIKKIILLAVGLFFAATSSFVYASSERDASYFAGKTGPYSWPVSPQTAAGGNQDLTGVALTPPGANLNYHSYVQGKNFSCILMQDQTVKCWGKNNYGQLGDGTTQDSAYPVAVVNKQGQSGTLGHVIGLSAGAYFACALLDKNAYADSNIMCWGENNYGQLGNGTNNTSPYPVTLKTPNKFDFTAVTTGHDHACALQNSGTIQGTIQNKIWCWGNNTKGELGTNQSTSQLLVPTLATQMNAAIKQQPVQQIVAGVDFTCMLGSFIDHTMHCWGIFNNKQTTNGVRKLSASGHRICALHWDSKGIECWQYPLSILPPSTSREVINKLVHTPAIDQSNDAVDLSVTDDNVFFITKNHGGLWAQGANNFAQLGNYPITSDGLPVSDPSYPDYNEHDISRQVSVSANNIDSLSQVQETDNSGITTLDKKAAVWGSAINGQLAHGFTTLPVLERPIISLGEQLNTGPNATIKKTNDGHYSWVFSQSSTSVPTAIKVTQDEINNFEQYPWFAGAVSNCDFSYFLGNPHQTDFYFHAEMPINDPSVCPSLLPGLSA